MKWRSPVPCLALLAVACGQFPRDPEGTLNRVRSEGQYRVGLIAPLAEQDKAPEITPFLARLSAATSARPAISTGDAEPLLNKLKQGEIDLVIGRFEKKSPWSTAVEIGPPLRREKYGRTEFLLAPVVTNGENAWVAVVEKAARDSGGQAR